MKKSLIIIFALSILSGCTDEFFDINRDPDNANPTSISLPVELPAGIVGIAGAQGTYYALFGGFWSQYYTQSNSASQYNNIDSYNVGSNDYNTGWTAMYDALGDIRNVKKMASDQENWNYYLIATTLEVHASQIMTDFYGSIPYTEANNQNILEPKFNSGPEVYDLMISDLKGALAKDLTSSQGDMPGNDDFIFNGDMSNWEAYANTLLLKLYMRQTKVNPTLAQTEITNLINSGVNFLDIDAAMTQFEDAPNRSNPLYESDRRKLNVGSNMRASTTMLSFLDENNDSRREFYYGAGRALNQGDYNNSTIASATVAIVTLNATDAVYFMSKSESLLLQAEALERYFEGVGAKEKYDQAVLAAFQKYSVSGTTFIASGGAYEYPAGGVFNDRLKSIITQKWLSGFPGNGFESFFDQNRTGFPKISDVPQTDSEYVPGELAYSIQGVTGGKFPKRIVYPDIVKTRNRNTPTLELVTTTVWWANN